jgi:hypothetical protein
LEKLEQSSKNRDEIVESTKEKAAMANQHAKEVVNRISEIRNTPIKKRAVDLNVEESITRNMEFTNVQPRSKVLNKKLKKIRNNISGLSKQANIMPMLTAGSVVPNKKFTVISGDIVRAIENSGVSLEIYSPAGGIMWKFESLAKQFSFCKKLECGLDSMKKHLEDNVSCTNILIYLDYAE